MTVFSYQKCWLQEKNKSRYQLKTQYIEKSINRKVLFRAKTKFELTRLGFVFL